MYQKWAYNPFSALFLRKTATISEFKERQGRFGISAKTAYLATKKLSVLEHFCKCITRSLTKKLLPIEKILLFEPF